MTKTPKQMLADLNAIRVAKGQKPIKAWKASTVKLAEALAKVGGKIAVPDSVTGIIIESDGKTVAETPKPRGLNMKRDGKRVVAKKVNGVRAVRTLGDGEVHLTSIAASAGMTPKNARAIARKHRKDIAPLQVQGKKYVFTKANVAKVKAILERAE